MLFFLTTQPIWVSGTILIGLTTVLAMLGPTWSAVTWRLRD